MTAPRLRGRVEVYHPEAGCGSVSDGRGRWWFHSTEISDDGSEIAEGTEVSFTVRPGRRGVWEAAAVEARP